MKALDERGIEPGSRKEQFSAFTGTGCTQFWQQNTFLRLCSGNGCSHRLAVALDVSLRLPLTSNNLKVDAASCECVVLIA